MARLSQVFAPKDRAFFDLFEEAANNVLRAAELLDEMLEDYPEQAQLARSILLCEQEGDRITYDIIQRLNSTFVTPIDREDILQLASGLDDVVDLTEEVADFLGLYRIEFPERSVGIPLTFRVVVRTKYGLKNVDYGVTVQPRTKR